MTDRLLKGIFPLIKIIIITNFVTNILLKNVLFINLNLLEINHFCHFKIDIFEVKTKN
jgi:hypothetical protein